MTGSPPRLVPSQYPRARKKGNSPLRFQSLSASGRLRRRAPLTAPQAWVLRVKGRIPKHIVSRVFERRLCRRNPRGGGSEGGRSPPPRKMRIHLSPDGPLDVPQTLARYRIWGEDPSNRLGDGVFRRVLALDGGLHGYAVRSARPPHHPPPSI